MGLLGGGTSVSGPPGALIQGEVERELRGTLRRLEASGFEFERPRPYSLFFGDHRSVSRDEVLQEFQSGNGVLTEPVYTRRGNESHVGERRQEPTRSLRTLDDLRRLDATSGSSDAGLTADERKSWRALRDLQALGYGASADPVESFSTIFSAWRTLREGSETALVHNQAWLKIKDEDQLFALAWSVTGTNYGIREPELAASLKMLTDAGLSFTRVTPDYRDKRFFTSSAVTLDETYQALRDGATDLRVGRGAHTVSLIPAQARTPRNLMENLGQAEGLYKVAISAELDRELVNDRYSGAASAVFAHVVDYCVKPSPRSPDERAAAIGNLLQATPGTAARFNVAEVYARITRALEVENDLERMTESADQLETVSELTRPDDGPRSSWKRALGQVRSGAQKEALVATLRKLVEATGDAPAALRALDLIRIPVGDETRDERLQIFLQLAGALPAANKTDAVADFHDLLAHRRVGESLQHASESWGQIQQMLSVVGLQAQTARLYVCLQDELTDAGADAPPLERVLEAVTASIAARRDLDLAEQTVRRTVRAGEGRRQSGVDSGAGDGPLIINGIAIPRHRPTG